MNAIRASIGSPPRLHSIRASIAIFHCARSDCSFGSFVTWSAASFSVSSFRPSDKTMGSSKRVDQGNKRTFKKGYKIYLRKSFEAAAFSLSRSLPICRINSRACSAASLLLHSCQHPAETGKCDRQEDSAKHDNRDEMRPDQVDAGTPAQHRLREFHE